MICKCFALEARSFTIQAAKLAGINAKAIEPKMAINVLFSVSWSEVKGIGFMVVMMRRGDDEEGEERLEC